MQALVFNLIMVTTHTFMGSYHTLDSCNKAIRSIYEKQFMPYPSLIPKSEIPEIQKGIDITVQYQRDYLCVQAK